MLRISLCLLFMAALTSAMCVAQQQDVQSLQYEFGRAAVAVPPVVAPCSCSQPVVYAPVPRGYCCAPTYTVCNPYYVPRYYYPAPKVYRRAVVRPVYCPPYYRW